MDGEKGERGGMDVGGEGDYICNIYIYRYTVSVTIRMTSGFRWAAMRVILMFHNCEGQSHKTVSTDQIGLLLLLIAFILCYSPPLSRLTAILSHVILSDSSFLLRILNIHRSGALHLQHCLVVTWLVPRETAAASARSVYTIQHCTVLLKLFSAAVSVNTVSVTLSLQRLKQQTGKVSLLP